MEDNRKIGKASREKGKRGERELAALLRESGFDRAARGVQYCGKTGAADVVGIPGFHIECKRVEKLNVEEALKQSERDAQNGEIPIVCHRRDRERWKTTMRLDKFLELLKKGDDDHAGSDDSTIS